MLYPLQTQHRWANVINIIWIWNENQQLETGQKIKKSSKFVWKFVICWPVGPYWTWWAPDGRYAVPYIDIYSQILTNVDKSFTKLRKTLKDVCFQQCMLKQKTKTPQADCDQQTWLGITNIDQILSNIDYCCIINNLY